MPLKCFPFQNILKVTEPETGRDQWSPVGSNEADWHEEGLVIVEKSSVLTVMVVTWMHEQHNAAQLNTCVNECV